MIKELQSYLLSQNADKIYDELKAVTAERDALRAQLAAVEQATVDAIVKWLEMQASVEEVNMCFREEHLLNNVANELRSGAWKEE